MAYSSGCTCFTSHLHVHTTQTHKHIHTRAHTTRRTRSLIPPLGPCLLTLPASKARAEPRSTNARFVCVCALYLTTCERFQNKNLSTPMSNLRQLLASEGKESLSLLSLLILINYLFIIPTFNFTCQLVRLPFHKLMWDHLACGIPFSFIAPI